MRILQVVHQYAPEHVGGTELYTQWLAKSLASEGHESAVFYRRNAEGSGLERRSDEGVEVWAARSGSVDPRRRFLATFGDAAVVRGCDKVLEAVRPDLVHIQHLMGIPAAVAGLIASRGIPYVITFNDYWWVCANAQLITNYSRDLCEGPRAYVNCGRCALARAGHPRLLAAVPPLMGMFAVRNQMLKQVVRGSAVTIAPSRFVGEYYSSHMSTAGNSLVIPHGLEDSVGPPTHRRSDTVRFGYLGGLSWQKGVHVAIDALREVKGGRELWIAGDETADEGYVGRLRSAAGPGVRFLGRLDRQGVWDLLGQVDVLLVPSLWPETFSFVVSEAFRACVPVIASRVGALAERVRDGVDGLLVELGDVSAWRRAMQRVVDEPGLLNALRAQALPPTTLTEHLAAIQETYERVLAGSRG
jgi:glycosyltransferase involved in cell wall biosynthesis